MASSQENGGRGLIQVYTGNGKGKTTAALGTVLRGAGHGFRIFIVFFMKGDSSHGEYDTLKKFSNVITASFGLPRLVDRNNVDPEDIRQANLALEAARQAILNGRYDLVVLDEVNVAVDYKLIELDDVIDLVNRKPANIELILTGRHADNRLIELADLVTEMVNVKHPFEKGINARKGIEY